MIQKLGHLITGHFIVRLSKDKHTPLSIQCKNTSEFGCHSNIGPKYAIQNLHLCVTRHYYLNIGLTGIGIPVY